MSNRQSASNRRTPQERRANLDWNFLSFETLFGASAGAFFSLVFAIFLGDIILVISLVAFSFCISHAIGRYFVRRRIGNARDRAEEEELERRALAARMAATARAEGLPAPRKRRRRR